MPTCQHCKTEWKYGESLRNLLLLRCPYCKEKNFARKFRIRDVIFGMFIPIIILFILPLFELSFTWMGMFALVTMIIYLATYPINLKLSKDEKPLF